MPTTQDHIATTLPAVAGASVSFMLLQGTWAERAIAGAVGALFSWVATPLFTPIMSLGIAWVYHQIGVDVASIPADSIPGFTGFVLGIVGLDLVTWITSRVKAGLAMLKIPLRTKNSD